MSEKIFVVGATGSQGGSITKLLLEQGNEVVTLSRNSNNQETNNLKVVKGGLENKEALRDALRNVDKAVFTFPLIFDMDKAKELTANFIDVASEVNLSLVVFNTGFDLAAEKTNTLSFDLKSEIHNQFKDSGLKVVTIVPDVYLDNLAAPWSIPVITTQGVLPYPIEAGQKIPWISHSDLAKYAVSALSKPQLAGEILPIGGGIYTGEEIADAITTKLGKNVQFVPVDPNDFEKQLAPAFGELAAKEISNLYRYVAKNKEYLSQKDFANTQAVLNVEPSSLKDWVEGVNWQ